MDRPNINRYKELARTMTFRIVGILTTSKTRAPQFDMSASVRMDHTEVVSTLDIAVSNTAGHILPMNGVLKYIQVNAPHRFRIMHRYNETEPFSQLSVCEGLYLHVGPIMGQLQIVGDYNDPVRCTLSYS